METTTLVEDRAVGKRQKWSRELLQWQRGIAAAQLYHTTVPQFSAQSSERNSHVLKRLVFKDTMSFLTDTSTVNVYGFPQITCSSENCRL